MTPESRDARLEEFHSLFWKDFDSGRVRPVEEYLARFPGLDAEIREELELANRGAEGGDATAVPVSPETEEEALSLIGRYEVLRRLKKGGMGLLLLARDRELGRTVVLKTPKGAWRGTPCEAVERLKREARIGGRLDIEGICPVLDAITDGDRVYVVMPYIRGETLGERIRSLGGEPGAEADPRALWRSLARRPSGAGVAAAGAESNGDSSAATRARAQEGDVRPALRLVERVARAIHEAHEQGIVHRDLKPDNVMIRHPTGEPVVLDLGLALDLSGEAGSRLTEEGQLLGTPDYMAPEQVTGGRGSVDRRTDVYALGVILYEVLTLRRPFAADSPQSAFARILRGDAAPLRKVNRLIPRDLEAVCLKAMDPDPHHRYGTALEFAEDLRRVRTVEQTVAKPLTLAERLGRRARRSPGTAFALAASVLLAIAATAFAFMWGKERKARETLWEMIRRNFPDAPDTIEKLKEALENLAPSTRSGGEGVEQRLLFPRATVSDDRPVFWFEVDPSGGRTWRYNLSVERRRGGTRTYGLDQMPGQEDTLTFVLPAGVHLEPGEYEWAVEIDPASHPGHESWKPQSAPFVVVPASFREEVLRRAPRTGRAIADRLLRAAALLANDLAEDARRELAQERAGTTEQEWVLHEFLCAHADALLGNDDKIQDRIKRIRSPRR